MYWERGEGIGGMRLPMRGRIVGWGGTRPPGPSPASRRAAYIWSIGNSIRKPSTASRPAIASGGHPPTLATRRTLLSPSSPVHVQIRRVSRSLCPLFVYPSYAYTVESFFFTNCIISPLLFQTFHDIESPPPKAKNNREILSAVNYI